MSNRLALAVRKSVRNNPQLTVLNASPYNTGRVITVSKEDYLKAILEAESEGENVISATLAHSLKVSPPAVTMAVRRLKKDGLVRVNGDGRVRRAASGTKVDVAHRKYDDTLTVTTGAGRVSLGVSAAERVWVKAADGRGVSKG